MDTAISNADFLLDGRGRPVVISGMQEILQRVLIRLTIQKGSFIYDPDLGSRLFTLKSTRGDIKQQAINLVREALSPMTEVTVEDVVIDRVGEENLSMKVILSTNNETGEVAIKL